ncbi:MAG: permease prefix domain 1-containing protein [Anaerolineae bacterium]
MTVDDVLARIRAHLNLEAETEYELLEEIRTHLEDAVAEARARGLDEEAALAEAAARFGVEEVGRELQATHVGWGTADGVVAAALPVICALILRWLVFAPDGTAVGWREVLVQPAFWVVSLAALLLPLLKFPRWRYALASWAFFWGLTTIFFAWPALRW